MKAVLHCTVLMILSTCISLAEIKNGYENQLQATITKLQKLSSQLAVDNLSFLEKQLIRSDMKALTDIISHYELTQQLINQFRIISPVLFNEMDSIKDKRSRPTHIFIKLIPENQAKIQLQGAAFFIQSAVDDDACVSEYGENSVSVNIWVGYNSLLFLSHELGHIKYAVPNLAAYFKFYAKHYNKQSEDLSFVGHDKSDDSGKMALVFEERFRRDLVSYLISGGRKFESPAILRERIIRNSRKPETPLHPELAFTWGFARR